jgi:hypothetical protein
MYIQVIVNKLTAWGAYPFEGYTKELPLIDYEDYTNNPEKYIFDGTTIKVAPDWNDKQAQAREENFKKQFFNIAGFGWFRKQPKGYASALEAVNTALNMVGILGLLPAGSFTFYIAPDFYKENQCTEEWLVSNSFKNNSMTAAEFGKFYADFVTAWNREEHL